jgi:hypothetical protein
MRISNRMLAGITLGFLISKTCVPVLAGSLDAQLAKAAMTGATIPCGPLSGDVANKLSWFIKASQVECMSPTVNDLQASILATSLLMRVPDDRVMSSAIVETEYRDGLAAYAAGHYVEALAHLEAAVPAKP